MEEQYKEVLFAKYCKTCKYLDTDEFKDPCNECLEHCSNLYSEVPVKYEKKEKER